MTTTTTNMQLVLPDVSSTVGPTWATLLNAAYQLIDSHDHSSGKGVQITPAGLNISSDLTFGQNNATNLRTCRLYNNSSISIGVNDRTCLYALNNELYYEDGNGNAVQITSGGTINVSAAITSLTLKDNTFTLQYFGDTSRQFKFSAANVPASTTYTYSLPNPGGNDTLVARTDTATVTNKTFDSTSTMTGVKMASFTPNGSNTITAPAATDTIAVLAASQSLTNKTIIGTTNTVNIADANFAIQNSSDTSKQMVWSLSGMTASRVLTLASSQSTSQTLNVPNITSSDTIAVTTLAQTLSAKTLSATPYINFTNQAAPSTPGAGTADIYVNSTDGQLHLLSSAGVDTVIGAAGSSTKNYLQTWNTMDVDPSSGMVTTLTATGNRTSNTTVWGANTTALLSQDTTSKLRGTNSAKLVNGSSTSNFIESPMFTLDGIDVNTNQLFISFDMYESDAAAASGDWLIQVIRYNSSGTFQENITPSITNSPTNYYQFKCAFTHSTTATDQYSIRWRSNSSSSRTLYIDSLVVGPQQIVDGASVGPWISFTPSYSAGFGTVTNAAGYYRRVGDSMEIMGSCTTGTVAASVATVTIPISLNIGTMSISNTSANPGPVVGTYANPTANAFGSVVTATGTSTTLIYFGGLANGTAQLTPANGSTIASNTTVFSFRCLVPISTYNATVTLAQSPQIEYASNSSSTDASDTSSFVYGAQGSQGVIGATNLTAGRSKRVRFQNPIQATDRLQVELSPDGKRWFHVAQSDFGTGTAPLLYQNGVTYGLGYNLSNINSTDVDVVFGQYSYPSGATYGAAGGGWSALSSAYRWRLAKYSGVGLAELAPATYTSAGSITRENIWTAYTPTISAGFGTVTSNSAYYKVLGDSLFVRGSFTTGTVAASLMSISLPSGFTISSSKLSLGSATTSGPCNLIGMLSQATASGSGSTLAAPGTSTTLVYVGANWASGNILVPQNGTALANSTTLSYQFEVPLV